MGKRANLFKHKGARAREDGWTAMGLGFWDLTDMITILGRFGNWAEDLI